MSTTWILVIIVAIVIVLVLYFISVYNALVRAKTRVDETWKQIDVRLQNRYDLLPDLIQAVEKAVSTDQNILTKIAELRSAAAAAQNTASDAGNALEKSRVENTLTSAINGLRVAVEAYPEIKSQGAIINFMDQDSVIEEKIAAARQIYNATVREYNEMVAAFPSNLVAQMFRFTPAQYFEAAAEARRDVAPDWGGNVVSR